MVLVTLNHSKAEFPESEITGFGIPGFRVYHVYLPLLYLGRRGISQACSLPIDEANGPESSGG